MIKFSLKLASFLVLFLSSVAHAGLLFTSDLTEENYVTIGELDWAWASIINSNGVADNEIYGPTDVFDPTLNVTWRTATQDELEEFSTKITKSVASSDYYLDLFTLKDEFGVTLIDADGRTRYKNALSFWNSEYDDLYDGIGGDLNIANFKKGEINSQVSTYIGSPGSWNPNVNVPENWYFETFYVRATQVPEPSTIMIFAIALIALSLRKRAIK